MNVDISSLQKMSPEERLGFAKRAFSLDKKQRIFDPNKGARYDRDAFERAEKPYTENTYTGRIIHSAKRYFELLHDDGKITLHKKEQFTHTHSLRVRSGDTVDVFFSYIAWRKRCVCRKNFIVSEDGCETDYCATCLLSCQWCDNSRERNFLGRPICGPCYDRFQPFEMMIFSSWNSTYRSVGSSPIRDCALCKKEFDKNFTSVLLDRGKTLNFCNICVPTVDDLPVPQWKILSLDIHRLAQNYLSCEQCRNGRVEMYTEYTDAKPKYLCRACDTHKIVKKISSVPVIFLHEEILSYD